MEDDLNEEDCGGVPTLNVVMSCWEGEIDSACDAADPIAALSSSMTFSFDSMSDDGGWLPTATTAAGIDEGAVSVLETAAAVLDVEEVA